MSHSQLRGVTRGFLGGFFLAQERRTTNGNGGGKDVLMRETRHLRGSGGMLPQKIFKI